jgi:hypothetical protein
MNTNPGGNTLITNAEETTPDSNGGFERFEALMSGLIRTPKVVTDRPHETSADSR